MDHSSSRAGLSRGQLVCQEGAGTPKVESQNEAFEVNYIYPCQHCHVFLGQFKGADICVGEYCDGGPGLS